MPDIQTPEERDAIERFFAAGGKITKCPTRYAERVQAGEDFSGTATAAPRELTYRERKSIEAERYKERRRIDAARKEKAAAENRRRRNDALALERARRSEAAAEAVGKVVRFIGADWTWKRISEAATQFKKPSIKALCEYLRYHGHGDKLPKRVAAKKPKKTMKPRVEKAARKEPSPQIDYTERNAAICRDYDAKVPWSVICKRYDVSETTGRRIVRDMGHARKVAPKKVPARALMAERDSMIERDYASGTPMRVLESRWGVRHKAILAAVKRAGGEIRKSSTNEPSETDRAIAEAYASGKSALVIKAEMGHSRSTVYRALERCKQSARSHSEALKLYAVRTEADERPAEVIRMHQAGKTTREIATALGYAGTATPLKLIRKWEAQQQGDLGL